MPRMNYIVYEQQQGMEKKVSNYRYLGRNKQGWHRFREKGNGKVELFVRRRNRNMISGWHLIRGDYYFEFCRGE